MGVPAVDPSAFFYLTAEVRWFRPGRIPQEIRNWFSRGPFSLIPSTRTDRYLVFPSSEHVGVKFREQRFEVKTLVRELDLLKVGKVIRGRMELWEKWSAGAPSVPLLFHDLSATGDRWTAVTKTRWMRVFHAEGEGIREMDPGDTRLRPEEGCDAEITEIEIGGDPFWTLGLESFGSHGSLVQQLTGTAQFLLQPVKEELQLSESDACAYPCFLRRYLANN